MSTSEINSAPNVLTAGTLSDEIRSTIESHIPKGTSLVKTIITRPQHDALKTRTQLRNIHQIPFPQQRSERTYQSGQTDASPTIRRTNQRRISPALDAPGCVLLLGARVKCVFVGDPCQMTPKSSEIRGRYFRDRPLLPAGLVPGRANS